MDENRYFTSVPIIGRALAQHGLDAVKDSHGNILSKQSDGWKIQCAETQNSRILSAEEQLKHDQLTMQANLGDPVGALLDNINLGDLESPLKTLCDQAANTPSIQR